MPRLPTTREVATRDVAHPCVLTFDMHPPVPHGMAQSRI
jgi:hypothetical protein